ncbi:hypothetical protein BHE74_00009964 [Ensete ventricosum]|nr:hypothetical protein BHE74_00009964 [Ensete ventricosum]
MSSPQDHKCGGAEWTPCTPCDVQGRRNKKVIVSWDDSVSQALSTWTRPTLCPNDDAEDGRFDGSIRARTDVLVVELRSLAQHDVVERAWISEVYLQSQQPRFPVGRSLVAFPHPPAHLSSSALDLHCCGDSILPAPSFDLTLAFPLHLLRALSPPPILTATFKSKTRTSHRLLSAVALAIPISVAFQGPLLLLEFTTWNARHLDFANTGLPIECRSCLRWDRT